MRTSEVARQAGVNVQTSMMRTLIAAVAALAASSWSHPAAGAG